MLSHRLHRSSPVLTDPERCRRAARPRPGPAVGWGAAPPGSPARGRHRPAPGRPRYRHRPPGASGRPPGRAASRPPGAAGGGPDAPMTRHERPVPADREGPSTPRGPLVCAPTSAFPPPGGGGARGEDPSSPRRTGRMDWPEDRGAAEAAMPGGQARMSGSPAAAQVQRCSHSRLTACPAPRRPATRRGRWWDAPSARAASLASSAALPVPASVRLGRGSPTLGPFPGSTPGPISAQATGAPSLPAQPQFGLVGAPSGEWSGQAEWMRFARLIHRPVRDLGGPAVRAAFGGNLKPALLATQGGTARARIGPDARPSADLGGRELPHWWGMPAVAGVDLRTRSR
jgi:hypothetical protein